MVDGFNGGDKFKAAIASTPIGYYDLEMLQVLVAQTNCIIIRR